MRIGGSGRATFNPQQSLGVEATSVIKGAPPSKGLLNLLGGLLPPARSPDDLSCGSRPPSGHPP